VQTPSTPDISGHHVSPTRAGQQSRPFRKLTTFVTKFATAISFFLFAAAALVTVIFLTQSLASSDRPRITSTWYQLGSQAILSVTVKLSEMKIGDTLNVSVRPVKATDTGADWTVGSVPYASQTGADAAGDGDLTFNVPLQLTPIFSCATEIAPVLSPTPSPSPSTSS
jgi:hypothetical protein